MAMMDSPMPADGLDADTDSDDSDDEPRQPWGECVGDAMDCTHCRLEIYHRGEEPEDCELCDRGCYTEADLFRFFRTSHLIPCLWCFQGIVGSRDAYSCPVCYATGLMTSEWLQEGEAAGQFESEFFDPPVIRRGISNLDLRGRGQPWGTLVEGLTFSECTFAGDNFDELVARNARFERCDFTGCRFAGGDFGGSTFVDCDFTDSDVTGPELIPRGGANV